MLRRWFRDVFHKVGCEDIADYRPKGQKAKLFHQKEHDWLKFGYSQAYLDGMRDLTFWDHEYEQVFDYDEKIKAMREE